MEFRQHSEMAMYEGIAKNMIYVGMGVDQPDYVEVILPDVSEQHLFLIGIKTTRIKQQCIPVGGGEKIGVFLKRAKSEYFKWDHTESVSVLANIHPLCQKSFPANRTAGGRGTQKI